MATRRPKRKLDADTDMQTSTTTNDPVCIRDLNLAESDRNRVRSGELNDKVIDAINTIKSKKVKSKVRLYYSAL